MWTTFAQTSKQLCIFEGNNTFRSCVRLQGFYYPPNAGLPIGGPGSSRFLRLEVHYHNPLLISGTRSRHVNTHTHTHPSVYCRTSFSFSHAHTSSRILQIYDGVAADFLIRIRSHNMHSYFSNFLQIFFFVLFYVLEFLSGTIVRIISSRPSNFPAVQQRPKLKIPDMNSQARIMALLVCSVCMIKFLCKVSMEHFMPLLEGWQERDHGKRWGKKEMTSKQLEMWIKHLGHSEKSPEHLLASSEFYQTAVITKKNVFLHRFRDYNSLLWQIDLKRCLFPPFSC